MYDAANIRLVNHRIPGAEYPKGGWLRSPLDLLFSFASEQAIDQLAYLSGTDPYIFRRRNIKDERWLGVLNAVAESAQWTERRAASRLSEAKVVSGRGIAVGTHLVSYGAAVAEIEVNKETGRVTAKKMYGAIDCGLAVNPGNVENQISGQLVTDCQPHVEGRGHLQQNQRDQPRLEQLSHSSLRRMSRSRADCRPARG